MAVHAEISVSDELESLERLHILQGRFRIGAALREGIRVEIKGSVFIVDALLLVDNVLVQSYLDRYRFLSADPVDRALDLAAFKTGA